MSFIPLQILHVFIGYDFAWSSPYSSLCTRLQTELIHSSSRKDQVVLPLCNSKSEISDIFAFRSLFQIVQVGLFHQLLEISFLQNLKCDLLDFSFLFS